MGEASKRIVKALISNDMHRDGLELNGIQRHGYEQNSEVMEEHSNDKLRDVLARRGETV